MKANGKLTKLEKANFKFLKESAKAQGVMVKFAVDTFRRTVACATKNPGMDHGRIAVSHCHPKDTFRFKTGKYLALQYAFSQGNSMLFRYAGEETVERMESILDSLA